MSVFLKTYLLFIIVGFNCSLFAQKVGVVLSGGGAAGVAHVGMLKALEENNIPIDYIAGTSMGGVVSSLYASGYSPDEIFLILGSDEYISMAKGEYTDNNGFFFKKEDPDASWVNFKLSPNGAFSQIFPTGVVSSVAMDFKSLEMLGMAEAAAGYNFDSLFIPFRCVASDIYRKRAVVLKDGSLTKAVRATATFPLYFNPISIDSVLLFDGGLYNNFPSDVMYNDFYPDIILGSNVADKYTPPDEDDLFSQFRSMIQGETKYETPCENGVIIIPDMTVGTFDFDRVNEAFMAGYESTITRMDEIKAQIARRENTESLKQKRMAFKSKFIPIKFNKINIEGLGTAQKVYVKKSLFKSIKVDDIAIIRQRYLRIFSDDKIQSIYPSMRLDSASGLYDLNLRVKKEKALKIGIGGNLASRPVSTGLVSAKYNYLGYFSASVVGKYYFGRFYNAFSLKSRLDFPSKLPFFIEPEYSYNDYDYFSSSNAFFEEDRLSYFTTDERYTGISIGVPFSTKGKVRFGFKSGRQTDEYYQTRSFAKSDTADITNFYFSSPYFNFERSSQTEKSYPNKGTFTQFTARLVYGEEVHIPGSTAEYPFKYAKLHDWFQMKFIYDNYYRSRGNFKLGFSTEIYYSSQDLFNNYSASIAKANAFKPTIESRYLFLETFRANQYATLGHKILYNLRPNLEFRLEGYLFQPYQRLLRLDDNSVKYAEPLDRRYVATSAGFVFRTPLGPMSLSANYYHNVPDISAETKTPLTFFFHFGYAIFNRKAFD